VVSGSGNARLFSCPFHKWGYALDGQLLGAPFMEGAAGFDPAACRLPEVRTEIVEPLGLIFITFSETAESIGDRLGDLCERLKSWGMGELVGIQPSELDAMFNWKIQLETGMECYHHFAAHPETFEVHFPSRLSWCEENRKGWGLCHSPARPEAPDEVCTMGLPVIPTLEGAEKRVFDLYHIYPLTRLSVHPDRIKLRLLTPIGPLHTKSRMIHLVRPEVAAQKELVAEKFKAASVMSAKATKEDYDVDVMQQQGAGSSLATVGRLSPLEATVWQLAEYIRARITAN
jgi:phenylpropionate dioxygenase-like ring-hydroxylating dioxygenase large terminal subunit